jgi:hypothetical protein
VRYANLFSRLVANSSKPDDQNEDGCWQWSGMVDKDGYGRLSMRIKGKPHPTGMRAHRVMEQTLRDNTAQFAADDAVPGLFLAPKIASVPMCPDEETLDHLCWCTGCTNPDHWVVATRAANAKEARSRDERCLLFQAGQQASSRGRRHPEVDHQQRSSLLHPAVRVELPAVGRSVGAVGTACDGPSDDGDDWPAARPRSHRAGESSPRLRADGPLESARGVLARERREGQPVESEPIGAIR